MAPHRRFGGSSVAEIFIFLSSNKNCPLFVKKILSYLGSSKSYRPPQFFAQNESCSFFCIIWISWQSFSREFFASFYYFFNRRNRQTPRPQTDLAKLGIKVTLPLCLATRRESCKSPTSTLRKICLIRSNKSSPGAESLMVGLKTLTSWKYELLKQLKTFQSLGTESLLPVRAFRNVGRSA